MPGYSARIVCIGDMCLASVGAETRRGTKKEVKNEGKGEGNKMKLTWKQLANSFTDSFLPLSARIYSLQYSEPGCCSHVM